MIDLKASKINDLLRSDLTRMSFKLFIFCAVNMDNSGRLPGFTQNYIGECLGVHYQQISRSFKELTENGILIKNGRDYYLNPDLFSET